MSSRQYDYTYGLNGNIGSMSVGGVVLAGYQYNLAGELVREDNATQNLTTTYSYDAVGNIVTTVVYPYTTAATPAGATASYTNTYNAGNQLTGWHGTTLSYDSTGNLLGFGGAALTWQNGMLSGYTKAGQASTYTYAGNGVRASKNVAGTLTSYTVDGNSNVIEQTGGSNDVKFCRSVDGAPQSSTVNGTTYYYQLDMQGDITGVLDSNRSQIVTHTYDAWGKLLATDGSAATVGVINPLRHKGYYYDAESGM